jgi:HK97 family phage major capsid protein
VPTKVAAALSADQLKALLYSLAPQYLRRAKWAMGWQGTALAIDQLKDGSGRYLWSEGQQDNNMSTSVLDRRLLGFQVLYSEFMQSVAANNYPIAFGDWMGYYLVERLGLSLQVLVETKAKRNQVEIIARRRFGGGVAEPYRLKLQKVAVS